MNYLELTSAVTALANAVALATPARKQGIYEPS